MMKILNGCLMLVAMGVVFNVQAQGIQGGSTFDNARFGGSLEMTPQEKALIQSAGITILNDNLNTYTPATIQALQNERASAAAAAAAAGKLPKTYTQQELDNFAADVADGKAAKDKAAGIDPTQTASTEADAKAVAEKADVASNKMCAMAKDEAAHFATSDADVKEFLANNADNADPSSECVAAAKQIFKSCSEGKLKDVKAAAAKADEKCQPKETIMDPSLKDPTSAYSYPEASPAQSIAEQLGSAVNQQVGNVQIPSMNMLTNPATLGEAFKNVLITAAAQKMMEMMSGGSGGSSGGSGSGGLATGTDTTTKPVCDAVNIQLDKEDPIVDTKDTVTTTTQIVTSLCKNGNIQVVKTVAVNDGTNVTTTTSTTVTAP